MNKRITQRILTILLAISICATVVSAGMYGYYKWQYIKNEQISDEVSKKYANEVGETDFTNVYLKPDIDKIKRDIPDTVMWLYIPKIDLSELVVQGKDDSFYLTHNEYKEYSRMGTVFLDSRNNQNIEENYLSFLFGHNSDNTKIRFSRFKELEDFSGQYFYIYQNHKQYKFKMIDYLFVSPKTSLYTEGITNAETFKKALATTNTSEDVINSISDDKRYMILVTCKTGWDTSQRRFIIGELESTIEY